MFKGILLFSLMSLSLFAQGRICKVDIPKIFQQDISSLEFRLLTTYNGEIFTTSKTGVVSRQAFAGMTTTDYTISPSIFVTNRPNNVGEELLYSAYRSSKNKITKHVLKFNFDLTKTDTVRVYNLNPSKDDDLGALFIVVAYDKNKMEMGSFLDGQLTQQCK